MNDKAMPDPLLLPGGLPKRIRDTARRQPQVAKFVAADVVEFLQS